VDLHPAEDVTSDLVTKSSRPARGTFADVRSIRTTIRRIAAHDASLAVVLTVAGLAEVLATPDADGSRLVTALALPVATLSLAWRGRRPLAPLLAITAAFLAQGPLDGYLAGSVATPLVALLVALYCAGRRVATSAGLAAAGAAVVAVTAARVLFDPAVERPSDAALTLIAVALPVLVGHWVRGQAELQARLVERSRRILRDRDRDARQAAEEERVRIASDLQSAIAGGLAQIAAQAAETRDRMRDGDGMGARGLLATIATTARDALADVRRVLGILRNDGQAPRLAPHDPRPLDRMGRFTKVPPAPAPEARAERRSLPAALADRLLVACLIAGGMLELGLEAGAPAALTVVPIALPLLARRRWPVAVPIAVVAAIALQSLLTDLSAFPLSDMAAVVCATYAVGAYTARTAAIAGLAGAAAAVGLHAAVFYSHGVPAALLGGVAAPWTVGRVVASHRRLTRQGAEDAASAERSRIREAEAAVTRERVRIARELHDAVAHNISVIAIQAGGAHGIAERDPARAIGIAQLIEDVAREAAGELDRLSGALGGGAAPPAPEPTLARIDALVSRARDAGQSVDVRVEGEPADVPVGVDLAAYRIVQEALANAAKHAGPAHASVTVRYERGAVEVEVADDGPGTAPAPLGGGGHGLVGIRERVGLYGGTLDLGPQPDGGFHVRARLPVPVA
jgi:signal transduction histidine kinase